PARAEARRALASAAPGGALRRAAAGERGAGHLGSAAGAAPRGRAAAGGERGVAELEARYTALSDSAALDAQVARLESDLRAREHLIELIRASSSNRSG